jgi:DNA invertase Pin-like site-specific DNA recombinase
MKALYPFMGIRRQAQIERALASWKPQVHKVKADDEGRILALVATGASYRAVAKETGFSYTTVGNIVARNHGALAQSG